MSTGYMLIIRDADGTIIAAQVERSVDSDITTFISPADPCHTVHRVSDVPAGICDLDDPAEFHRALTEHVASGTARIAATSADELRAGSPSR